MAFTGYYVGSQPIQVRNEGGDFFIPKAEAVEDTKFQGKNEMPIFTTADEALKLAKHYATNPDTSGGEYVIWEAKMAKKPLNKNKSTYKVGDEEFENAYFVNPNNVTLSNASLKHVDNFFKAALPEVDAETDSENDNDTESEAESEAEAEVKKSKKHHGKGKEKSPVPKLLTPYLSKIKLGVYAAAALTGVSVLYSEVAVSTLTNFLMRAGLTSTATSLATMVMSSASFALGVNIAFSLAAAGLVVAAAVGAYYGLQKLGYIDTPKVANTKIMYTKDEYTNKVDSKYAVRARVLNQLGHDDNPNDKLVSVLNKHLKATAAPLKFKGDHLASKQSKKMPIEKGLKTQILWLQNIAAQKLKPKALKKVEKDLTTDLKARTKKIKASA